MSHPPADDPSPRPPARKVRLNKYLAASGLGSRREVEAYILEGRVSINGKTVESLAVTVDPEAQVALDGRRLKYDRPKYYLLNKPKGCLCTNRDPEGRRRVIDLFPPDGPRLFTVGRLDENSEGLLIVTNDGDLAQRLAHPKHQILRTYMVQVAGMPSPETCESLQRGVYFSDGRFTIQGLRTVRKQGKSTYLEILLAEGHNREIRRLMARVGHKVMTLQRVAFGPIRLGNLEVGEYRELRETEVEQLKQGVRAPAGRRPPSNLDGKTPQQRFSKRGQGKQDSASRQAATGRGGSGARSAAEKESRTQERTGPVKRGPKPGASHRPSDPRGRAVGEGRKPTGAKSRLVGKKTTPRPTKKATRRKPGSR